MALNFFLIEWQGLNGNVCGSSPAKPLLVWQRFIISKNHKRKEYLAFMLAMHCRLLREAAATDSSITVKKPILKESVYYR